MHHFLPSAPAFPGHHRTDHPFRHGNNVSGAAGHPQPAAASVPSAEPPTSRGPEGGKGGAALLADPALQGGVKLGLAGILALGAAQLLRLPHPNWALFTVIVLMGGEYVEALAPRALARVAGTVLGGLVAVWLLGNHEPNGVFFLLFTFGYVAACLYGAAGTLFPNAFFLCAQTLVAVAANGMGAPVDSWRVGLYRVLEILVGVAASVVVANLFWPRFARGEFLRRAGLILDGARRLTAGPHPARATGADLSAAGFALREETLQLRVLLQTGSRESRHFRRRLTRYAGVLGSLTRLLQAGEESWAGRPPRGRSASLDDVGPELLALSGAIERACARLCQSLATGRPVFGGDDELAPAFATLERRLGALHAARGGGWGDLEEALDLASRYEALATACEELAWLRTALPALPRPGVAVGRDPRPPARDGPPSPGLNPHRLRDAIKAALATTLSLLLVNWLHPPGALEIPLNTLLLCFPQRFLLGGRADQGSLSTAFLLAAAGLLYVEAMFLLTPLLSNYVVMNIFLFVALGVLGTWSSRTGGGATLAQTTAMVFVVSTVILNPQRPVGVGLVIGNYFSVVLPLAVATVVSRLCWPVLPHQELRRRLTRFFEECAERVTAPPAPDRKRWNDPLLLLPLELDRWIGELRGPGCSSGELARWRELGESLRGLARHVTSCPGPALPSGNLQLSAEDLRAELGRTARALGEVFRRGAGRAVPDPTPAQAALRRTLAEVWAQEKTWEVWDVPTTARCLSVAQRLDATADALVRCREQAAALRLEQYCGDYAL